VEPAAERRHEMWGLAGIHDVDLHAFTYQREQGGESLVEGHGRWIVAEERRRLAVKSSAGPGALTRTRQPRLLLRRRSTATYALARARVVAFSCESASSPSTGAGVGTAAAQDCRRDVREEASARLSLLLETAVP